MIDFTLAWLKKDAKNPSGSTPTDFIVAKKCEIKIRFEQDKQVGLKPARYKDRILEKGSKVAWIGTSASLGTVLRLGGSDGEEVWVASEELSLIMVED